jgi:hypothetical protein
MRLTPAQRRLLPPDDYILLWLDRPQVKVTPRRLKKWRMRYAHQVLRCAPRGFDNHQWRPAPSLKATHGPGAERCCRCRATFMPIPF